MLRVSAPSLSSLTSTTLAVTSASTPFQQLLPPPSSPSSPSFDISDPTLEAMEEVRYRYRPFPTVARRALLLTLPIDPIEVLNSTTTTTTSSSSQQDEDMVQQNNDDDDDDDLFFDLYKSPCLIHASNDEFTFADLQVLSRSCGETFFGGCYNNETELIDAMGTVGGSTDGGGEGGDNGMVVWTIMFDYEVYYPSDVVDPIPAIDHLETIVLEHLSEVTNLNQCNGTTENTDGGAAAAGNTTERLLQQTTSEYLHDFSEDDLERMMAISGDPSDTLDPDYASCMVPVPASISESSNCMPVTGAIRLYLNNTGFPQGEEAAQKLAIESGFQRLIRFGMRQGLYNSGDVIYVSFIGTRLEDAIVPVPFPTSMPVPDVPDVSSDNKTVSDPNSTGDTANADGNNTENNNNNNNSNKSSSVNDLESNTAPTNDESTGSVEGQKAGIIIGSVGAVVLCLLVWSLFAVQRRKRTVAAAAEEESDESDDVEEGLKSMRNEDGPVIPTDSARTTNHNRTDVHDGSVIPTPPITRARAAATATTPITSSTSQSDFLPTTFLMVDTMEDEDDDGNIFDNANDEPMVKVGSVRVFQDDDDDDDVDGGGDNHAQKVGHANF